MRKMISILQALLVLQGLLFFNHTGLVYCNSNEPGQPIKIGLLINDKQSIAAREGAELAIRKANEKGGISGHPLQLVVRSMEGPWGTGSKQAVNLVFEEEVWALLGSHDGRNAHLVEQVSAKSHVVFLSAWASDPTLSKAFVPWFFNMVPNDLQQASALVDEIYVRQKMRTVAVVYDEDYNTRLSRDSFLKKTVEAGLPEPLQISASEAGQDANGMQIKLSQTGVKALVVFCQPATALRIIRSIRQFNPDLPIYGPLLLLDENAVPDRAWESLEPFRVVSSPEWSVSRQQDFCQAYRQTWGNVPGAVAAYAFDAASLLVEAIRHSWPDRQKLQRAMLELRYNGVTGPVRFDEKGNRTGRCALMNVRSGCRVAME